MIAFWITFLLDSFCVADAYITSVFIDKPPVITEEAAYAGMSPTKLKRLFRQIFDNSIFNYQDYLMREASRMRKEEKLSVTEVGYKLGYTNLSHFYGYLNCMCAQSQSSLIRCKQVYLVLNKFDFMRLKLSGFTPK